MENKYEQEHQEEIDFLKARGLIKEGFNKLIIKGDFGEIDLADLLYDYALTYQEIHDQGVWGQKPL